MEKTSSNDQIVMGEGWAILGENDLYAEACESAFDRALVNAVQKVHPTEVKRISELDVDERGMHLSEWIRVFEVGHIRGFGNRRWSVEVADRGNLYPDVKIRVKLDVTVSTNAPERDEAFDLWAVLAGDQATFTSEETPTLRVRTSKDAFLRIFNQTADGRIKQIFPNDWGRDNRITAGEERMIPDARSDQWMISLETPLDRRRARESFVLVATKVDKPFWPAETSDDLGKDGIAWVDRIELLKWLTEIDSADLAIGKVLYTVHAQ